MNPPPTAMTEVLPGLYLFEDTCNVYVVCGEHESLAIDFGSGGWLDVAEQMSLPPIKHILLTHHHADQCNGLALRRPADATVHASVNEKIYLQPEPVAAYWKGRPGDGCPLSYSVLEQGLDDIHFDLVSYSDLFWDGWKRIRCIDTPGHGPGAVSVLIDHGDQQVLFCGDAAHSDARVWQPFHLEWDHWTASGALAAWQGLRRIATTAVDLLCPSHGPIVRDRPGEMLDELSRKILRLIELKGSVCPGERDHYLTPTAGPAGSRQVSPSILQLGMNGYLVLGDHGEALGIDFREVELDEVAAVLSGLEGYRLTHLYASHFHIDHVDGLLPAQERFGGEIVMHESVAEALTNPVHFDGPWQSPSPIIPQQTLSDGPWRWNRFTFHVAHYPGQTWWHSALMGKIDGQNILFGGDNFQPNSRWTGTGGFSAYNGCRFAEGFEFSATQALGWSPDAVLNGHQTYHRFTPSQYEKIVAWSRNAEQCLRSLCPNDDIEKQYHRRLGPQPWPHFEEVSDPRPA